MFTKIIIKNNSILILLAVLSSSSWGSVDETVDETLDEEMSGLEVIDLGPPPEGFGPEEPQEANISAAPLHRKRWVLGVAALAVAGTSAGGIASNYNSKATSNTATLFPTVERAGAPTVEPTRAPITPSETSSIKPSPYPSMTPTVDGYPIDLSEDLVYAPHYPHSSGENALNKFFSSKNGLNNACIRSAIVLENGQIVAEHYNDGNSLSVAYSNKRTRSDLYSVTKGWLSIIFGILVKEGLVDINETLEDIWPIAEGDNREKIWSKVTQRNEIQRTTIKSLLTMTSGFTHEYSDIGESVSAQLSLDNGTAGGISLVSSLNDLTYAGGDRTAEEWKKLETCKVPTVPLENASTIGNSNPLCRRWQYIPTNNILSYVIETRTGMSPKEYASQKLFKYLNIANPKWHKNLGDINVLFSDQTEYSGHGLYLSARENVKLGQLMLQNGKPAPATPALVDEDWIAQASSVQVARNSESDYGYFWRVVEEENIFYVPGILGQYIYVDRHKNRAISILASNNALCFYFSQNQSDNVLELINSLSFGPAN